MESVSDKQNKGGMFLDYTVELQYKCIWPLNTDKTGITPPTSSRGLGGVADFCTALRTNFSTERVYCSSLNIKKIVRYHSLIQLCRSCTNQWYNSKSCAPLTDTAIIF
jgi:hypothetical protein